MTGHMVPELWCNDCLDRVEADAATTLQEFRAEMKWNGWCSHRPSTIDAAMPKLLGPEDQASGLVDFCGDCCPICFPTPE